MKRKILLLAILASVLCLCLVSCAPKPKKLYNVDYKEEIVYKEATNIGASVPTELLGVEDSLAVFTTPEGTSLAKKTSVVNVSTGKILLALTDTSTCKNKIDLINPPLAEGSAFVVTMTNSTSSANASKYEITLYNSKGKIVDSYIGNSLITPTAVNDLILFNNKAFKVSGDTVSRLFEVSPLASAIPNCRYVTENYNYALEQRSARIYNSKYELVASYDVPSYATTANMFVMSDGNVLIQYIVKQAADAKSYDFLQNGEKFTLESVLLKAKSGKAKSLNLKHVIASVDNQIVNKEFATKFTKKVKNCAVIYEIEDKLIDQNNPKTVSLKKNGKVKKDLEIYITSQRGELELVADNRFVATNKQGQSFLLNERGEILGEITKAVKANALKDGFIIFEDKIYNYDLKPVLDMAKNGYVLLGVANSYAILKKTPATSYETESYYLFSKETGLKSLNISTSQSISSINDKFFVVDTGSNQKIYSSRGVVLVSSASAPFEAWECEKATLLAFGTGNYYIIK